MATPAEITARFAHHPPTTQERIDAHQEVRGGAEEFAQWLNEILPESREKALALTALQETALWANAAIAIHFGNAVVE